MYAVTDLRIWTDAGSAVALVDASSIFDNGNANYL
jgi:hypothetical protein